LVENVVGPYFLFADAADRRRHFAGAAAADKNPRRAAADSLRPAQTTSYS